MTTIGRLAINSGLPTIVARQIVKYTMPQMVMRPRVTNAERWAGISSYGGIIQIPTFLTRPTPTQQNTGSDSPYTVGAETLPPSVTFSAPTISNVQLVLDQWWYYAFQRTAYADAINNGYIDWDAIFKTGGVDGLVVKIDGTLTNLFGSVAAGNVFGVDGAAPGIDDILNSAKVLDSIDVPQEDRTWVFSTGGYLDLTQLEAISNQLYIGSGANMPVVSGKINRQVYGTDAFRTTNLTAGTAGKVGGYFHKEFCAIAMRKEPFSFPPLDNPNTLSREFAMFAVWGVKVIRSNFGAELQMES